MSGAPNITSNPRSLPVPWHGWCDFGGCTLACARRCDIQNGRWDGAPTHWWREVWKALRLVPKPKRRRPRVRKWLAQPVQLELV